jgi:hypothetical protein
LDAQVMAVALATYVTRSSLAGQLYTSGTSQSAVDHVTSFGFSVTLGGLGSMKVNVGDNGEAFGIANHAEVSIMVLLLATNERSHSGILFDADGSGHIDATELSWRMMANEVCSLINEHGEI